jgi:hypothetical protein
MGFYNKEEDQHTITMPLPMALVLTHQNLYHRHSNRTQLTIITPTCSNNKPSRQLPITNIINKCKICKVVVVVVKIHTHRMAIKMVMVMAVHMDNNDHHQDHQELMG